MLDDVLPFLRCPICYNELARAGAALRCEAGHSFDIARQGYVTLRPAGRPRNAGDTPAMVHARQRFLAAGHYGALAHAVAEAAAAVAAPGAGCVADVGAGPGYYLASVLDRLGDHVGLALDISKAALRMAARSHQRAGAVGCDAWRRLPVADGAADLVLNVFAPRDGAELRRILRPAGHLLVVTPGPDHLAELIGPLGLLAVDARKEERLAAKLSPYFAVDREAGYRSTLMLDHAAITALVAMGPSAWHAGQAALASRIAGLHELTEVTLAARLTILRPTGRGLSSQRHESGDSAV